MGGMICPGIQQEGNSIKIDLSVYFSSPDAIPAKVFADSVNGMNQMLGESKLAIMRLLGIDGASAVELYLQTVRNGSKIQDFFFKIILGSDDEANHTAEKLHKRFGLNKFMESKHIQNVLVAALVTYLVANVAGKYMDAQKAQHAIEASNSVILNAGRDLNVDPKTIEQVFRETIANPPRACKGALLALQPAKMKSDTVVKIGDREGEEIPAQIVSNMPNPAVIQTKELPAKYDLQCVNVSVMASDIDRRKTGWAVKLPPDGLFAGKRIHAELDPTIDLADVMYREFVTADITIYQDRKGNPKKVYVRAVHPDDDNIKSRR